MLKTPVSKRRRRDRGRGGVEGARVKLAVELCRMILRYTWYNIFMRARFSIEREKRWYEYIVC